MSNIYRVQQLKGRRKSPRITAAFIRRYPGRHWPGCIRRKINPSCLYRRVTHSGINRLSKFRPAVSSPGQDAAVGTSSAGKNESTTTSSEAAATTARPAATEAERRKRVQIHSLKEVSSPSGDGNYNSPDVQFILEVKRSNVKVSVEKAI